MDNTSDAFTTNSSPAKKAFLSFSNLLFCRRSFFANETDTFSNQHAFAVLLDHFPHGKAAFVRTTGNQKFISAIFFPPEMQRTYQFQPIWPSQLFYIIV